MAEDTYFFNQQAQIVLHKEVHLRGKTAQFWRTLCAVICMLTLVGADQLYGAREGKRTISIHNIHTKETLTVTYKVNGVYDQAALKKINHIMRDWRRNESRIMRKDLIDLMWEIHDQLGSKKPIHLISGYRSRKTNNKLRKTRGGQARSSRHILGMAADVHFPDVPVREIRDSALIREKGGVGYYPTSGLPFVHMDVGRVRHWPRLSRPQLASLFPSGRTRHRPKSGRPITKADAIKYGAKRKQAKMRRIQLARRLTRDKSKGIAVAALTPEAQGVAKLDARVARKNAPPLDRKELEKRLAALTPATKRRQDLKKQPPANDAPGKGVPWWRNQTIAGLAPEQIKLEEEREFVQLASVDTSMPEQWLSFTPRQKPEVIEKKNVAYSPEFDEEHPEEFNYRPFSLSPLMTDEPLADNQEIAKLSPPDYASTAILLNESRNFAQSRFRPGLQHAHLKWANKFTGFAVPGGKSRNK